MAAKKRGSPLLSLERLLASMPGNVYWKDRNGRYLGCNEKMAKILKLKSPAGIVGKTLHDLLEKSLADPLEKIDEEVMKNNVEHTLEERCIAADGSLAVYLTKKIPLLDQQDSVIGLLGISFDITERKEAEEALRTAQAELKKINFYLNAILRYLPENLYVLDQDSRVLICNESQATYFGLDNAETLLEKNVFDIANMLGWKDQKIAEAIRENDLEVMQTKQTKRVEESLFVDGKETIVLSCKHPLLTDTGEVVGVVGISTDITEQKRIEVELAQAKLAAENANQAKTNFLAMISHDLRSPLNAIANLTDILTRDTNLTAVQLAHINDISASSRYLSALITNILNFTKLEASKLELSIASFDLKKMISSVINSMQHQLEGKAIALLLEYDDQAPTTFVGDALRIQQVVVNLIGNAIKFIEQGSIRVTVICTQQTEQAATLMISIIDTGRGISQDKLGIIFDRFTQVDQNKNVVGTQAAAGLGLGLAICRELIILMGGQIGVESEVGKGSRFWFELTLPLAATDEVPLSLAEQAIKDISTPKQQWRVLLIEDDLINQRVVSYLLDECGCRVDVAAKGQQAITLWGQHAYDVVFIDMNLPDMHGTEIAKHIRDQETKRKSSPTILVALTGSALEEERRAFLAVGINDILIKPLQKHHLEQLIQEHSN